MRISELIKQLEKVKELSGDSNVEVLDVETLQLLTLNEVLYDGENNTTFIMVG